MEYELPKKLVENGKSGREIAKELQVSQTGIRFWLNKFGLKTKYKVFGKQITVYKYCKTCKTQLTNGKQYRNYYCNNVCKNDFEYSKYIERWKNGLETGSIGRKMEVSSHIRRWMFQTRNHKCEKCGWDKINIHTGKKPLQVDHIDGDFTNNKPENLRLLCPNCHSLTPTWGRANKNRVVEFEDACDGL